MYIYIFSPLFLFCFFISLFSISISFSSLSFYLRFYLQYHFFFKIKLYHNKIDKLKNILDQLIYSFELVYFVSFFFSIYFPLTCDKLGGEKFIFFQIGERW